MLGHTKDSPQLKRAKDELAGAWINAERDHPVLTSYRAEAGQDKLALVKLGSSHENEEMRMLVREALNLLSNIYTAKLAIEQKKIKVYDLGPVVAMTRAEMVIPLGSVWDIAVREKMAGDEGAAWAKTAFSIALGALSLFPGTWVLALVSLGLDLYDAGTAYVQYGLEKALYGSRMDRAKAISNKEPSLVGFAIALVGAGMGIHGARSAFKEAQALRTQILSAGSEEAAEGAVKALNKLGADHGVADLGSEVAKTRGATKAAPKAVDIPLPDPPKVPVGAGAGKAAKPPPPPPRARSSSVGEIPPDGGFSGGARPRKRPGFDKGKGARPAYHKDPLTNKPSGSTVPAADPPAARPRQQQQQLQEPGQRQQPHTAQQEPPPAPAQNRQRQQQHQQQQTPPPPPPPAAKVWKPTEIAERGYPLGFKSRGQYDQFGEALEGSVAKAGYKNAEIGVQGSAVTGTSSSSKAGFDVGRTSDLDVAVVEPSMFARAEELGIPVRDGHTRFALTPEQAQALGIADIPAKMSRLAGGRTVNLMVFTSRKAALFKEPHTFWSVKSSHIYGVDAPSLEDARSSVQRALGVELVSHDSDYRGGLYFRLGEELILQRSDDPGDPDWVNPDAGGSAVRPLRGLRGGRRSGPPQARVRARDQARPARQRLTAACT